MLVNTTQLFSFNTFRPIISPSASDHLLHSHNHLTGYFIEELQRPRGPLSRAPHSYREEKETHEISSHDDHGQRYCLWARTHDDDDGGGTTRKNTQQYHTTKRLIRYMTETFSLGLPCTSLIYYILCLDISVIKA